MPFNHIKVFECQVCQRTYRTLPEACICEKASYFVGQIVGSFLLQTLPDDEGNVICSCVLCAMTKVIHISNIKKQTSCGCKPYHVEIHAIKAEVTEYKCKRCGKVRRVSNPIVTYCCEEEQ